jgi:hypothetical protein
MGLTLLYRLHRWQIAVSRKYLKIFDLDLRFKNALAFWRPWAKVRRQRSCVRLGSNRGAIDRFRGARFTGPRPYSLNALACLNGRPLCLEIRLFGNLPRSHLSMSELAIYHPLRIGKGSIGRNDVSEMPVIRPLAASVTILPTKSGAMLHQKSWDNAGVKSNRPRGIDLTFSEIGDASVRSAFNTERFPRGGSCVRPLDRRTRAALWNY